MKKVLVIVLLALSSLVVYSQRKVDKDFAQLKWLVGDWVEKSDRPGETHTESWKMISESKLVGKGIMQNADTLIAEDLQLLTKGEDIFFIASPANDTTSVVFKLTLINQNSFVFENPQHRYPKKITYQYEGGKFKVTTSGDDMHMDFFFERKP